VVNCIIIMVQFVFIVEIWTAIFLTVIIPVCISLTVSRTRAYIVIYEIKHVFTNFYIYSWHDILFVRNNDIKICAIIFIGFGHLHWIFNALNFFSDILIVTFMFSTDYFIFILFLGCLDSKKKVTLLQYWVWLTYNFWTTVFNLNFPLF
jgi:hypothetical protein